MFPTQFSHPFLHLNSPAHTVLFFLFVQSLYILAKYKTILKTMYIFTHAVSNSKGDIHISSLLLYSSKYIRGFSGSLGSVLLFTSVKLYIFSVQMPSSK